jgi:hypothetical protein
VLALRLPRLLPGTQPSADLPTVNAKPLRGGCASIDSGSSARRSSGSAAGHAQPHNFLIGAADLSLITHRAEMFSFWPNLAL